MHIQLRGSCRDERKPNNEMSDNAHESRHSLGCGFAANDARKRTLLQCDTRVGDLVENDQPGLVARRKTLVDEGKGVRILDLDVSIGKKLVGAASWVHWNTAQQACLN